MFGQIHEQPSIRKFLRHKLRQLRGVNKWPTAEAKVLSCSWVVSDSAEGASGEYEIQFTFDLANTSYYGSFSLPGYGSDRLFATGDLIRIHYNPKNPEQSLYSDAWSAGEQWFFIALFLCLFFFGHWLITGSPWFFHSSTN